MPLYPLLLEPIYKEKVWGGRSLARMGRPLPGGPEQRIGESWEVADLFETSASGGGGDAAHSRISNGPLAGRTLRDVMKDLAPNLLGSSTPTPSGAFPLLCKYLDARENLSVQVHPSPAYAAEHPTAHLKSEAWYVVAAEPGSVLYLGLLEGTTPDALRSAVEDGTVADLMIEVPVEPGDCYYLPSGTCHALGSGIVVAEVQTPSDTTFRVFDWGRTDRELHVEEAIACADYGPLPVQEVLSEAGDAASRTLVRCEHFEIREWILEAGASRPCEMVGPTVLMFTAGSGMLEWGTETRRELAVTGLDTVLLPADRAATELHALSASRVLAVTLP